MQKKYVYKEKEYKYEWQVREAIKQDRIAFGAEPEEGKAEFWKTLGVTYTEEPDPEPTKEELLAQAKYERAKAVAAIKVTVDNMVFDGDETSQSRMARALTAAEAAKQDSTVWVLADNAVATVTKAQLAQALARSMEEMAKLWTAPYEAKKVNNA